MFFSLSNGIIIYVTMHFSTLSFQVTARSLSIVQFNVPVMELENVLNGFFK